MPQPTDEMIQQLAEDHVSYVRELLNANGDFAERLKTLPLTGSYDRDDDVLTITLGSVMEAATESLDNRLFIRYDPGTQKIVGFEIAGVRSLLEEPLSNAWRLRRSIESIAAAVLVGAPPPKHDTARLLGRSVRHLASA